MTNNSSKSRAAYVKKLAKNGFATELSQVYTASSVTARYFQKQGYKKVYCVSMCGLPLELAQVGITPLGGELHKDRVFDREEI